MKMLRHSNAIPTGPTLPRSIAVIECFTERHGPAEKVQRRICEYSDIRVRVMLGTPVSFLGIKFGRERDPCAPLTIDEQEDETIFKSQE